MKYGGFKFEDDEGNVVDKGIENFLLFLAEMGQVIFSDGFIQNTINIADMIQHPNRPGSKRLLTAFSRANPLQWRVTNFINDAIDPSMNNPQTLSEYFANENRIIFGDYVPSRYNIFGEPRENRVYHNIRTKSGVVAAMGWGVGVNFGYEQIGDPALLNFVHSMGELGMRLPTTNGQNLITDGNERRRMTRDEREMYFKHSGREFARLIKADMPRLQHNVREIENGNERQKEELERRLRNIRTAANREGVRRVEIHVRGR